MINNYKNYNPLADEGMRELRLSQHHMEIADDIIVVDELEKDGTLKLYERICKGSIEIYSETSQIVNATCIASIEITAKHDVKEIKFGRISCEYGYDDLREPMLSRVLHFAQFYGYSLVLLDLRKNKHQKYVRTCRPYQKA